MSFRNSELFSVIKAKIARTDEMQERKSHFSCYHDDIFVFDFVDDDGLLHEFSFSCDDDLVNEEYISDLISLKRISYFAVCIYDGDGNDTLVGEYNAIADIERVLLN